MIQDNIQHRQKMMGGRLPASANTLLQPQGLPLPSKTPDEPFIPFAKPFDPSPDTDHGPPTRLDLLELERPVNTTPVDNQRRSLEHDKIPRPWAETYQQGHVSKPIGSSTSPAIHDDPLSRWRSESARAGPYHAIAGVGSWQGSSHCSNCADPVAAGQGEPASDLSNCATWASRHGRGQNWRAD